MKTLNEALLQRFKSKGLEVMFAEVLQPKAYASCCATMPSFDQQHRDLIGQFYDGLAELKLTKKFKYALFDDIQFGVMGGFYAGFEENFRALINLEGRLSELIKLFMDNDDLPLLSQALNENKYYCFINNERLHQAIFKIEESLSVSKALLELNCARAAYLLKNNVLPLKIKVLAHLYSPSFENNLPKLYKSLEKAFLKAPPINKIIVAFYRYKLADPTCLDTSPLFFLISNPTLAKQYKVLFSSFYHDDKTHAKSKKGHCLFDVNEVSSGADRFNMSAFSYALQCKKVDIAYALFRSKAQFTQEEFATLVHLSIFEQNKSYECQDMTCLSNDTFHVIDWLIENRSGAMTQAHINRFHQFFHAWIVRCSDLNRQKLFLKALNSEMLRLAILLSNKPGVNINTRSTNTGKTLLHLAVEQQDKKGVKTLASNPQCDFNQLDLEGKHVLEKSSNPLILAPIIYALLKSAQVPWVSFKAQQIKPLLKHGFIYHNKNKGVELVKKVKNAILFSLKIREPLKKKNIISQQNYPHEGSLSLSFQVQESLLPQRQEGALTTSQLKKLKTPRESILVIEPLVRQHMIHLYESQRKSPEFLALSDPDFKAQASKAIDDFIYGGLNKKSKGALIKKRRRLRIFAKAIVSNRMKTAEECLCISNEASHIFKINKAQDWFGFITNNVSLINRLLFYCEDAAELYSSSFASMLLAVLNDSLIILVASLEILRVLIENRPPKLIHYVHIAFTLSTTVIGVIAASAHLIPFPVVAISLALTRHSLIFSNELINYHSAPKGSDKQKAHAQACVERAGKIIFSALVLTSLLLIATHPIAALAVTSIIISMMLLNMSWDFTPMTRRMSIKQSFGLGKEDYQSLLNFEEEADDEVEEKRGNNAVSASKSAFFSPKASQSSEEKSDKTKDKTMNKGGSDVNHK